MQKQLSFDNCSFRILKRRAAFFSYSTLFQVCCKNLWPPLRLFTAPAVAQWGSGIGGECQHIYTEAELSCSTYTETRELMETACLDAEPRKFVDHQGNNSNSFLACLTGISSCLKSCEGFTWRRYFIWLCHSISNSLIANPILNLSFLNIIESYKKDMNMPTLQIFMNMGAQTFGKGF